MPAQQLPPATEVTLLPHLFVACTVMFQRRAGGSTAHEASRLDRSLGATARQLVMGVAGDRVRLRAVPD